MEFSAEFPELPELNLPTPEELGTLVYYSLDVVILFLILAIVTLALIFLSLFGKQSIVCLPPTTAGKTTKEKSESERGNDQN